MDSQKGMKVEAGRRKQMGRLAVPTPMTSAESIMFEQMLALLRKDATSTTSVNWKIRVKTQRRLLNGYFTLNHNP